MKDCPRCDSSLSHYALSEGEAYGCDACGWVGVDVEHRSTPAKLESWHDAISRFEAKFANDGSDSAVKNLDRVRDDVPVPDDEPKADPEPTIDRVPADEPVVPTNDGEPAIERSTADGDVEADADEADVQADPADADEDEQAVDVGPEPDAGDVDESQKADGAEDAAEVEGAADATAVEDDPETSGDGEEDPDGVEEDAAPEAA